MPRAIILYMSSVGQMYYPDLTTHFMKIPRFDLGDTFGQYCM